MLKNRSEEEHKKRPGAKMIRSLPLYVSSKDDPEEMEKLELGLLVGLKHTLKSLTNRIAAVLKIVQIPQFYIEVSLALLVD
jgi:hypothetical protein